MSREVLLNQSQLQEAHGLVDAGVMTALGSSAIELFNPHEQVIPRPNFGTAIYTTYGDRGIPYLKGLALDNSESADLHGEAWHNMRITLALVSADNRLLWYPAVILPSGMAAYLETDAIGDPATYGEFSELQHFALDNAYLTATSNARHGVEDTNAAESKHGLILASQPIPKNIHETVHAIDSLGDFTTRAGARGIQDIGVNGETKQIRPQVISLDKAFCMAIQPEYQPAAEPLFGLQEVSPQQLLIAGTLAAATSRGLRINVENNVTEMVARTAG